METLRGKKATRSNNRPSNSDDTWTRQFSSLFHLSLHQTVSCRACTHTHSVPRDTSNPFGLDNLPIRHTNPDTLPAALCRFFLERLSHDYKCEGCQHHGTSSSSRHIDAAPHYLRIPLNRTKQTEVTNLQGEALLDEFDNPLLRDVKNHNVVEVPEMLDLKQYQTDASTPLRYKLVSVLRHDGRDADSGHWIAVVRNGAAAERPADRDTFVLDDEEVFGPVAANWLTDHQVEMPGMKFPITAGLVYEMIDEGKGGGKTKTKKTVEVQTPMKVVVKNGYMVPRMPKQESAGKRYGGDRLKIIPERIGWYRGPEMRRKLSSCSCSSSRGSWCSIVCSSPVSVT
ncbi:cysteine proteinase [Polyplosphaeria fusca]|uniref:ubiquitinyl hydrolase 1 n=1 Tax=Polyplosphaeria fusca TaxID=682080 RepID=A0A9P4QLH4_9PLEO|nr:cysteine proteinase [Polyplosphaeria fusca]